MKTRVFLLLAFTMLTLAFTGCEDDAPPANNVGSITFIITEENTPETLSGVTIELYSNSDPSVTPTDRTDNSGRCTFSNIPVGTYQVNIRKSGYESKSNLTLRINGGNNPYKEISLKRATNVLTVAPDVLDFGENASVVQKAFSLVNPNYQDLTWAVLDTDVPWIVSVCDKDGKKNGTIKYNQEVAMSVIIDRDKLEKGDNESTIVILSDYGRAELVVKAVGADKKLPQIERFSSSSITAATSAHFEVVLISDGGAGEVEVGVCWDRNGTPSIEGNHAFTVGTGYYFYVYIDGLSPSTMYYVRAYAKNKNGIVYSGISNFTTKDGLPTVKTEEVKLGTNVLECYGNVTKDGGFSITRRGFCYSTHSKPTIDDNVILSKSNVIGEYCLTIENLEEGTTYYVRAFAENERGVSYGDIISSTTLLITTFRVVDTDNMPIPGANINFSNGVSYECDNNGEVRLRTDAGGTWNTFWASADGYNDSEKFREKPVNKYNKVYTITLFLI